MLGSHLGVFGFIFYLFTLGFFCSVLFVGFLGFFPAFWVVCWFFWFGFVVLHGFMYFSFAGLGWRMQQGERVLSGSVGAY